MRNITVGLEQRIEEVKAERARMERIIALLDEKLEHLKGALEMEKDRVLNEEAPDA